MTAEWRSAALQTCEVRMQWGIKIPLRDEVHLSANLYLPRALGERVPVIVTLTPYIAQTFHDQALYFASRGYPFLAVDSRGRGNSEGVFRPMIQEAQDGYDVVEWTARQSFCNGQVAMWGGSYGGYDQWVTAKESPPHLTTIIPIAAPHIGTDVWMRNNIPSTYLMRWLTLVSGRTSQEKIFWGDEGYWNAGFREWFESGAPFRELDRMLGNPSAIFQEWLNHPHLDGYWDRYNPTSEDYSKLSLPILTITGMYDSDQPGALMHYREHLRHAPLNERARHYLVIGPWHHAGTRVPQKQFAGATFGEDSLVDISDLHLQWYAWTMGQGPKPEFLQKNVAYYVTGAERWRYADTLEHITRSTRVLHLDSTGTVSASPGFLSESVGTGSADHYLYDPRDTRLAALEATLSDPVCLRPTFPTEDLTDQTLLRAREGQQLIYHSEPFGEDAEVSGFFALTAWISIDQLDTDFGVSIYEIDYAGGSLLLTFDLLRARYRESLREDKLIRTTEPLRYDFERFTFVSRLVRKGSRLCLAIGPLNSIHFQKNYNSGGIVSEESMKDARTVTVQLFHDSSHPSALYVPLADAIH